jgi:N-acetylmuramoyl-L-alanine amidase
VIDPGHGGDDVGAIGPRGTREKDVALAIAGRLSNQLSQRFAAKVYLTRSRDKYISLDDRDKLAVSKGADVFVSIHANAAMSRKMNGIETYYLNNATDKAAERLAMRENKAEGKKLSDVEHILSTMLQNYDTVESKKLAIAVQNSLMKKMSKKYKGVKNRNVRSALFYVLVGAKCPAILVETSFISNPIEEKRLTSAAYQDDLATAIADGVSRYLINSEKADSPL